MCNFVPDCAWLLALKLMDPDDAEVSQKVKYSYIFLNQVSLYFFSYLDKITPSSPPTPHTLSLFRRCLFNSVTRRY